MDGSLSKMKGGIEREASTIAPHESASGRDVLRECVNNVGFLQRRVSCDEIAALFRSRAYDEQTCTFSQS